jgi:hypothetical protein
LGRKRNKAFFSTSGTTSLRREEQCTTKSALRAAGAQREPKKYTTILAGQK